MKAPLPDRAIDIFLQPGELYFGDKQTRIRTFLGSCVSLVFWHPQRLVGGMCHYMLPSRTEKSEERLDGRYADEALVMMYREMQEMDTEPREYHVKIFGGANMFPDSGNDPEKHIGERNVQAARDIVKAHGLNCVSHHLSGIGHRSLVFDVWSGHVWVKHQPPLGSRPASQAPHRHLGYHAASA